ncbi:hypothetical protein [Bradyrhizobium sp.]|nr:hypothetical protein [Bradyrhizobium sp.]
MAIGATFQSVGSNAVLALVDGSASEIRHYGPFHLMLRTIDT